MRIFRKRGQRRTGAETPADLPAETGSEQTSPAKADELKWGRPARCPNCRKRGYLDSIDVVHGVMYQHCTSCWHDWTITKADIETGTWPK